MTASEFISQEQTFFRNGNRRSIKERKQMLSKLLSLLETNREKIYSALYEDLRKSETEAALCEYIPLLASLKFMRRNLKKFASPKRVGVGLVNFPGRGRLLPEPYGVALIISAWNYPLLLSLDPLIGAIAAGNSVVMKFAPAAPATARFLAGMLTEAFDEQVIYCDESTPLEEILNEKFDCIFYTGGERTGKIVAAKAAATFTPVTLEMGGKSPCIIDESANLALAAKRIVWGKFLNSGQTCVAPDYLLVHEKIKQPLLNLLRAQVQSFYTDTPENSPDYSRIVNVDSYNRLSELLNEGKLITGGEKNPETCYIAPTILDDITIESKIMEYEIFGPILPVITVKSLSEAIDVVNRRAKPLALYCFARSSSAVNEVLRKTSSGGVSINDTIMHLASPNLPFGGVGASGMGQYHGRKSYESFSHSKPILYKSGWLDLPFRYPPFTQWKQKLIKLLEKF